MPEMPLEDSPPSSRPPEQRLRQRFRLSHASADLAPWRRHVVCTLERLGGAARVEALGGEFRARHRQREAFWGDVVATLRLTPRVHGRGAGGVPASGALLVVANHPFGMADGAVVAATVAARRHDLRVIVWDIFSREPETETHLLALDLAETSRAARRQNLAVRREALAHLGAGGAVLLFPSGSAERSRHPFGEPREMPWHRFAARLAVGAGVTVLPVFVAGHNSRLFHVASHLGDTVRRSLFLRELNRRVGSAVDIVVGTPIASAELAALDDDAILQRLFEATMSLARTPPREVASAASAALAGPNGPNGPNGRVGRGGTEGADDGKGRAADAVASPRSFDTAA